MQMDAAGLLLMTFLSASFAGAFSADAQAHWHIVALASSQHVLPLLIMATSMPWCACPLSVDILLLFRQQVKGIQALERVPNTIWAGCLGHDLEQSSAVELCI